MKTHGLTLRAFVLGTLLAGLFSVITVYAESRRHIEMTSTQMPVLPYLLLIVVMVGLNPLLRRLRVKRVLTAVELMIIFTMGTVSAGLSTYGLVPPLVGVAGSLFNADWNHRQSEWNRYLVPYLNDRYFVSEPGIQAEAVKYRQALDVLLARKSDYEAARQVATQEEIVTALEANLAKTADRNPARVEKARAALAQARDARARAVREWQDLRRRKPGLPDWEEALRQLPGDIDVEEHLTADAEKRLLALEKTAFERVAVFRRGLPRNQRAFPGIVPMPEDDRRAYFGRLHRLIGGLGTLRRMKQAALTLRALPADQPLTPELAASCGSQFDRSSAELMALCDDDELSLLKQRLDAEDKVFIERRLELASELKSVSLQKRGADRRRAATLARQSAGILRDMKQLAAQYKHFRSKVERYHREKDCADNVRTLAVSIADLSHRLAAGPVQAGELAGSVTALLPDFASIDVSLRRYFAGQIPWICWVGPLARWGLLIALTYAVLMSLNVLIFRQWAHNERLTYPLAELPRALIGETDSAGLPPVFRNGLFWAGVAVSLGVLGWNLFCSTQIIPGLASLDLQNGWAEYVDKTPLDALRSVRSEIFFTMIGLAFLVPKNISLSLWFFYVIYLLQLLLLVWTGHGQNAASFPWDWWYQTSFRNAQGQGALIVFSSVVLFKCRRYILCGFFPSSVADLETAERNELKASSIAFLGCSLGLILLFWRSMGANLYYTILFYAFILIISIGLIRVVAEGGLLGFQAWANPLHFLRNFFGLDRPWTAAPLYAPLMIYYSIAFLDIKTFVAPAMANALKLRDDYRVRRGAFHVAMAAAMIVAAVAAVLAALLMAYGGGADSMGGFLVDMPRDYAFNAVRSAVKDTPTITPENIPWTLGGGLAMAALLFLRQFFFWMPHPIGLIMFVNPIMNAYWFPIFIGWLCNVAVTKYGNKESFLRARGFFIGLIIGELIVVVLAFAVNMALGTQSGIDLNRNA